ncbi:MAG TPA: pitrilysin family protein [Alphaproteobacteria bacterium]|nr:pitrilysin family protein [Alphaproteobacteria bacterium]
MGARRLSVALAALAVFFVSFNARAGVFYPKTFTLKNGLQVVVVENHLAPAVLQMVWYKIGSADEVPPRTGLAHYLEHLMFRGTKKIGPGKFSRIVAAQGGNDNAFTSYDYTGFYEMVAKDRLPLIMRMDADRMHNLDITPKVATPELQVVLDERQQRTDNDPGGRFEEHMRRALMPDSPYGRPVIGWKPQIEKLTAADAMHFYHEHYAPNNAVVVIVGDVDAAKVEKLAEKTYGRVPRRDVAPRKPPPPPGLPSETSYTAKDPGVAQPQFEWLAVVPSYSTQKGDQAYAFEVLEEALDSGEVGRLYRDLVVKQGVASGIDVDYDPDARSDTVFAIALVPQPGKDPKTMAGDLRDELRALAKTGLDPQKIENAKKRLQREAIFARDGLTAAGYDFGEALTTGHKVADVEAWPDRIASVTPEQVDAALKYLVADKHAIAGLLLPEAGAKGASAQPMLQHGESIR